MTLPADVRTLPTALEALVTEVPASDLPALIAALEGAKARAWLRLATPGASQCSEPESPYLDASQIARRLNVPEHWIRDRARRGEIPCERLGHYMRFRWPDVEAAVQAMIGARRRIAAPERRKNY